MVVQLITYQELIDSYVDEIEENEDNLLNSYMSITKPLSFDEHIAREHFLEEKILSFEKQIEIMRSEIEGREEDEAWYEEVLRDED